MQNDRELFVAKKYDETTNVLHLLKRKEITLEVLLYFINSYKKASKKTACAQRKEISHKARTNPQPHTQHAPLPEVDLYSFRLEKDRPDIVGLIKTETQGNFIT